MSGKHQGLRYFQKFLNSKASERNALAKKVLRYVLAAAVCGLLFNVVFDPMVGYFYKLLILGKPAAQLVLAWNITSTSINAVTSTFVSVAIYMPLLSALIRAGLFDRLR